MYKGVQKKGINSTPYQLITVQSEVHSHVHFQALPKWNCMYMYMYSEQLQCKVVWQDLRGGGCHVASMPLRRYGVCLKYLIQVHVGVKIDHTFNCCIVDT